MRKIIVTAEVSLDGVIGGENADFWQQIFSYHTADVHQYLNDLLFTPDALVMGRKTFEIFATVWPAREGKDADRINSMPKYVASRTHAEPLPWNGTLIKGDAADEIRRIKQQPGNSLLQYGVGELTQTMLKHELVDEIRIVVYPVAFGNGPRIFEHMGNIPLQLLEMKRFSSGAVALHYQPHMR